MMILSAGLTYVAKALMRVRLFSLTRTVMDLTKYLAPKAPCVQKRGKSLVVARESDCKSIHKNATHLRSSQEEEDTKMIFHNAVSLLQPRFHVRIATSPPLKVVSISF